MLRKHRNATLALALVGLVLAAVRGRVRRFEVVERSMAPALEPGDYVVAVPVKSMTREQIVIFTHPERPGFDLVKRVVGLPNDTVTITNGQVHINGNILPERWADGPTQPDGKWHLGSSEIFVLGDNRALSAADSRQLGPIPAISAEWRVVARYWPLRTAGRIMPEV